MASVRELRARFRRKGASERGAEVYSEATSRRQVPALFKDVGDDGGWRRGSRNGDIGGGAWDDASGWLGRRGVDNVVYDPGNRDDEWNRDALDDMLDGQCDTVTVANVLNVIPEQKSRDEVIELAANCLADDGTAYFGVHEGHGDGQQDETRDGYQENRRLDSYVPEVEEFFDEVEIVGRRIEARSPVACRAKAVRREYGL
jgi:hypothetical protein